MFEEIECNKATKCSEETAKCFEEITKCFKEILSYIIMGSNNIIKFDITSES